jgi:polar amino acid transport system substrate-binding protein
MRIRIKATGTRFAALALFTAIALLLGCAQFGGKSPSSSPVLDRVLKRGELVVGTAANMPPPNMTTRDGKVVGMEPDLARYLADTMGVDLRLETMQFSELIGGLKSGKVDMVLSSMSITPHRNLEVAFAGPYFISGKCVLTKVDALASVESASDINRANLRITALAGSTSAAFVEEMIPQAQLNAAPDYDSAVSRIFSGEADVMVADYPICLVTHARHPDAGLISVITRLTYEPIGIALPAGDPLLLNFVDNTLQGLAITGQLDRLQDRWFKDGRWLEQLP